MEQVNKSCSALSAALTYKRCQKGFIESARRSARCVESPPPRARCVSGLPPGAEIVSAPSDTLRTSSAALVRAPSAV
eukprot:6189372-Pleurochrysis_carterae.AAC.1